jgi:hypothetical protein
MLAIVVLLLTGLVILGFLPPRAAESDVLLLETITHGGLWWTVRWVSTEYHEAVCFSEAEVEAVLAWLSR